MPRRGHVITHAEREIVFLQTKLLNPHRKAELTMLAAAVLWSTGGVLIKQIPWNALVISGMRSALAAVVLFLFMRTTGAKIRFNRYSIGFGSLLTGLMFSFVIANKLTTAANAIVLEYTSPVLILVFSAVVLKQKFHAADWIAVIAVFLGISLFFFDRLSPSHLTGNCVALLSGIFCAGGYILCGEADTDSRLSGILFSHVFTAIVGLPFIAVFPPKFTPVSVACVLALGVFQIGVSYILYALAMRECPPFACSLLGAVEPLLNPVWVFLFNGEAPGSFAMFGGAIVLISVTGWCVWRDHFLASHQT